MHIYNIIIYNKNLLYDIILYILFQYYRNLDLSEYTYKFNNGESCYTYNLFAISVKKKKLFYIILYILYFIIFYL